MARTSAVALPKPVRWVGGSKEDLSAFPEDVRPTFRAVYTVRFARAVYVLHAFQEKPKRGIATPKGQLDVIERRLKRAQEDYEQWSRSEPATPR